MIIRKSTLDGPVLENGPGPGGAAHPSAASAHDQPVTQTVRAALLLRQMLLHGDFKPGERLREIPLAEQLGVSRIPLRLALEQLANEGLLELRPTRGFVAQQFSLDDVYDSIELRAGLEGTAAQLAAQRVKDRSEVARMQELNDQMLRIIEDKPLTLEPVLAFGELNAAWHLELLRLARSRLVSRAMDRVCALPFAAPSAFMQQDFNTSFATQGFQTAMQQHAQIADLIAAKEAEQAAEVARQHSRVAHWSLENALKDPHAGVLVPSLKMLALKTES